MVPLSCPCSASRMASVLVESMVGKWRTLPANGVPASSRRRASSSKASAVGGAVGMGGKDMSLTFGHDAHAEVYGDGGVGQCTGGDEVDAGFGVFADGVQLDAAGGLNRHLEAACVDQIDGRA